MRIQTTYADDLLIVVNAFVEPDTLFGWVDIGRIVHQYARDIPLKIRLVQNSIEFLFSPQS